jgi:molybdate transport system substrate-binding protein
MQLGDAKLASKRVAIIGRTAMKRGLFLAKLVLFVMLCFSCGVNAADLSVLITNGIKPVVTQLGPDFERSTGHKLKISYQGSNFLQADILRGDNFDATMLLASNMDAVAKANKISPSTRINIATSGLGVVVRAGQPKPDISTVDAFKRTMLNAKSIAYASKGASGLHFIKVCEQLGIADEVRAKARTKPSGMVAEFVASGEAELAIQQMSELISVKGTDLVGPFPKELDLLSRVVAAVSANSNERDAALAFTRFFTAPPAVTVIKSYGMQPG